MSVYKEIYSRLDREKEIVGFAGKKRSGKDTAGEALEDLGYKIVSLADPIKETCSVVFKFNEEQVDGSKKKQRDEFWDFTPRWAMQQIGTELFRDGIDEDVWVKSLLARIDESDHDKFAVTDVRFPNEVMKLTRAGGDIIYIKRPETEPDLNPVKKKIVKFAATGSPSWKMVKQVAGLFTEFGSEYHASEVSLDDHPVSNPPDIVNDGSVDQFKETVRRIVKTKESGIKSSCCGSETPTHSSFVKHC